jgi:hypothetical protein
LLLPQRLPMPGLPLHRRVPALDLDLDQVLPPGLPVRLRLSALA